MARSFIHELKLFLQGFHRKQLILKRSGKSQEKWEKENKKDDYELYAKHFEPFL